MLAESWVRESWASSRYASKQGGLRSPPTGMPSKTLSAEFFTVYLQNLTEMVADFDGGAGPLGE